MNDNTNYGEGEFQDDMDAATAAATLISQTYEDNDIEPKIASLGMLMVLASIAVVKGREIDDEATRQAHYSTVRETISDMLTTLILTMDAAQEALETMH